MERKYYLNPGNCIVCCLTCICFLILSAAMLTTSRYGTVLIFAATGIFSGDWLFSLESLFPLGLLESADP